MNYKIREIELNNIRNIKHGLISLQDENGLINNVTGIYGQNASGKSSVIKAIDFVKKIVDYRYSETDSELLIHFDSDVARIRIQIQYGDNIVDYTIFVKRGEFGIVFEREQLVIDDICVFDVDHHHHQIITNHLVKNEYQMELTVIAELAYESGKSCFGSKYSYERLSDGELSNYPNAIKAIYCLSSKINIISDHDSSLNNIDDNLVIFDLNEDGIDDLTIDLDNNGLVKKVVFEKLEKQFKKLNIVIKAIVPSVELVIKVEDRSDKFYQLSYFTKRQGIDSLVPLSEESYGIKKIISLAFSLMQVMKQQDFILFVDELDAGIFEYLLGQLVEVIDDYAQGQLIFTSHNLRAVEVLGSDAVIFTTNNLENGFIKIPQHEYLNNMRETYYRAIVLQGNQEQIYSSTSDNDILMGLMSYE